MLTAQISRILTDLEALLRETHAYGWANEIEKYIARLTEEPGDTLTYLASTHIWGGSGTLFDLILSPDNGQVSDDFRRDNYRLSELLLELITALRANGYNPRYFDTRVEALHNAKIRFQKQ